MRMTRMLSLFAVSIGLCLGGLANAESSLMDYGAQKNSAVNLVSVPAATGDVVLYKEPLGSDVAMTTWLMDAQDLDSFNDAGDVAAALVCDHPAHPANVGHVYPVNHQLNIGSGSDRIEDKRLLFAVPI